jgi:hypothetical protein
MVKYPFCGGEFQVQPLKTWRFRFYSVESFQRPKRNGILNHYSRIRPKGGKSEFVIRVRPR